MSEKYFYLNTDFFSDMKIRIIERSENGDAYIFILISMFKLASNFPNAGGVLLLTNKIPFTAELLSLELDIEKEKVLSSLKILEEFQLISIIDYKGKEAIKVNNLGIFYKFSVGSRNIPKTIKNIVLKEYNGRCAICGSDKDLQIDHIFPYIKGGTSDISNLQILCRKCNINKKDKTSIAF